MGKIRPLTSPQPLVRIVAGEEVGGGHRHNQTAPHRDLLKIFLLTLINRTLLGIIRQVENIQ
ncbi:MAG: hypothetical protein SVT56_07110, partial [Chloroflexota bacterium]|nr:hypothetical protein [Chloroflexota bacterium]